MSLGTAAGLFGLRGYRWWCALFAPCRILFSPGGGRVERRLVLAACPSRERRKGCGRAGVSICECMRLFGVESLSEPRLIGHEQA